jgi:hypothetical protein
MNMINASCNLGPIRSDHPGVDRGLMSRSETRKLNTVTGRRAGAFACQSERTIRPA